MIVVFVVAAFLIKVRYERTACYNQQYRMQFLVEYLMSDISLCSNCESVLSEDVPRLASMMEANISLYDKNGNWDRTTTIGQWRLTPGKTYTVLTSDFLHKGGDGMAFFSHGTNVRYLPLKMRDGIMDYVTSHDTLKIPQNPRYYEIK